MITNVDSLAKDIAELIKNRINENDSDPGKISYYDAICALDEIKNAVNRICPDLETVLAIKKILDKYHIDPLDQAYFVARASMDADERRKRKAAARF